MTSWFMALFDIKWVTARLAIRSKFKNVSFKPVLNKFFNVSEQFQFMLVQLNLGNTVTFGEGITGEIRDLSVQYSE